MRNKRGDRGVTLVEVMIALVILLIVFMGLLQAALLSIDSNTRNEVRDESVRIASDTLMQTRAMSFAAIASVPATAVTRSIRNQTFTYTVTVTSTARGADDKEVAVQIDYTYRGEPVTYQMRSIVRNR